MTDMDLIDLEALKKWLCISEDDRLRIKNSFFCSNCGLTTIENYTFTENKYGIVMKGNCKKCGGAVVRLLEDIQK